MTSRSSRKWIVVQLGARENYSVARALHRRDALSALITDMWGSNDPLLSALSTRLRERVHPELKNANVISASAGAIAHELNANLSKRSGWDRIIRRNNWFQSAVVNRMKTLNVDSNTIVFAYSYAAERVLKYAKSKGATTVLGQIDPALFEAKLISRVYEAAQQPLEKQPDQYWEAWRRETQLADHILVNSKWSETGLVREGVESVKIKVVPLAGEFEVSSKHVEIPSQFTEERPLRLLFLGQVNLRKGVDLLLDAVVKLDKAPLRLDVVGPIQIPIASAAKSDARIQFHGAVPRGRVIDFYKKADVFVFPTRSDGFGLTQLEALAAGTPVLASKFCGEVIEDGNNGLLLNELTVDKLAEAIERLYNNPSLVTAMMKQTGLSEVYGIEALGRSLEGLVMQQDETERRVGV